MPCANIYFNNCEFTKFARLVDLSFDVDVECDVDAGDVDDDDVDVDVVVDVMVISLLAFWLRW